MQKLSILFTILVLLAVASYTLASAPLLINYQGWLTDDAGNPVDGTVSMVFTIYDSPTGPTSMWSESWPTVTVVNGGFNVILGSNDTPIPDDVFDSPERYLGIQVEADPEISPRIRLVSVPYSHRVSTVDGASGGVISGDVSIQGASHTNLNHSTHAAQAAADLDVDGDLRVAGKATIGPGHTNTGDNAFVAGVNNTASGIASTVGGGGNNIASNDSCTVAGGGGNTASGLASTVAGGMYNEASGISSTVSGGNWNRASNDVSTIAGGFNNIASGNGSMVAGGVGNTATGTVSFAAGVNTDAIHDWAFVWSDGSDVARFASTGDNQFLIRAAGGVGIGLNNPSTALDVAGTVDADAFTINGTPLGTSSDTYWSLNGSDIFYNAGNVGIGASTPSAKLDVAGNIHASGKATIGPGHTNTGDFAFVAGFQNTASAINSTVGGGADNIASGDSSTVAGGGGNTASGINSTVGGGADNTASGDSSTVAGGGSNTAIGATCTIGGGMQNVADGIGSTVGGGINNDASEQASTIAGGNNNEASANGSTVAGGNGNVASGVVSFVAGGNQNEASGSGSFAAGRNAKAINNETFVWSGALGAGDFVSTGDNQFLIRAAGGVGIGTNSPQGALDVSSTIGALIVPRMTTAERDALAAVNGMIIYNTSDNQFNFFENGAWVIK